MQTKTPPDDAHHQLLRLALRSIATDKTERVDIEANPAVPSGFKAAADQCIVRFTRSDAMGFIAQHTARLTACETELFPSKPEPL